MIDSYCHRLNKKWLKNDLDTTHVGRFFLKYMQFLRQMPVIYLIHLCTVVGEKSKHPY